MIVVIADDLSGAAELAGIAAARGYRTEVQTRFVPESEAEVVALDTDTRLCSERDAVRIVRQAAAEVAEAGPEWIFKKTDSVLRGHVRAEIEGILAVTDLSRCLLMPANPSKQRTIQGGRYSIAGIPVDRTVFGSDPDFPIQTADVRSMLGDSALIRIPDVEKSSDFPRVRENGVLPAGGADYFAALLPPKEITECRESAGRVLIVSGSLASWQSGLADQMQGRGFLVHTIDSEWDPKAWERTDRLLLAIGSIQEDGEEHSLLERLVERATLLVGEDANCRIALEGGATAIAFLRRMGWNRFEAVPENHVGVGSLRAPTGAILSVKPGSYPWPESLFPLRPSN